MNRELIKNDLVKLFCNLFESYNLDKDLIEYIDLKDDLGMDSITFVSFVVEIEAHFNIVISDELLLVENFRNIDNITDIIIREMKDVNYEQN